MTTEQFLLFFLSVHIVFCVALVILFHLNMLHIPRRNLMLAALLPFWGGLMVLFAEFYTNKGKAGNREQDLSKLEEIRNIKIRRQILPEETIDNKVVPLEEALVLEDPDIRRNLILEIVQEDPKHYIALLKKVQLGNDTEVSHYASTAIMEVQRIYELNLRQKEYLIKGDIKSEELILDYINTLNEYIHSGLLSDNVLIAQRKKLNTFYVNLLFEYDGDEKVYKDAIDNLIELNDVTAAESLLIDADTQWENDEELILLKLKLFHKTKNRWAMRKEIQKVRESGMYLSPETREVEIGRAHV